MEATTDKIDSAELFRRYFTFVSHFVLRMGVPACDVDDVLQDVFMSAHRKGGYAPGAASPKTWLARLSLGVVSTYKRSRRRRREVMDPDLEAGLDARTATPSEALETAQSLARVQRALDVMDLDQRAVFVLFELVGESCDEIARGLEVPIGTVYSRLHAARRAFLERHARLVAVEGNGVGLRVRSLEVRSDG